MYATIEKKQNKKMQSSKWILALQTYHAFVNDSICASSIADECYQVGVVLPDIKEKENAKMKRKGNWIIPTKGTDEYDEVKTMHQCFNTNPELELMARELLRIQKENEMMHKSLLQINS
tara:strand:+ start:1485 stop:1841 length:357 start_codon:yes stop_codon:yes gene_type:complete